MYNEYIANEGKVLLNISTFNYGNRILSKEDIAVQLVETTKEIAEQFKNEYDILSKNKENDVSAYNINTSEFTEEDFKKEILNLTSRILTNKNVSRENIQIVKHE